MVNAWDKMPHGHVIFLILFCLGGLKEPYRTRVYYTMYVDKESDFRKLEGKNISVFKYKQISVERTKFIIKLTWHDKKS